MKVTRRTEQRLIVEDRPWLIAIFLILFGIGTIFGAYIAWAAGEIAVSLFFAAFSSLVLVSIYLFVRRVQVIFDRTNDTITFRTQNLRTYSEIIYPLGELSHAVTEGTNTARSVLVMDKGMSAGRHPVTLYSTSGPAPQRITDAINTWLKTTAPVDSDAPEA